MEYWLPDSYDELMEDIPLIEPLPDHRYQLSLTSAGDQYIPNIDELNDDSYTQAMEEYASR